MITPVEYANYIETGELPGWMEPPDAERDEQSLLATLPPAGTDERREFDERHGFYGVYRYDEKHGE